MMTIRRSHERGASQIDWLQSWHSFSFADYYDPRHMGFGPLRVINEDTVAPGRGFDTHGHRDMEIISYILSGELEHKDSVGNGSVIRPGRVQRMTAGTGIRHSEFNPSPYDPVHFLQVWILPERNGLRPGYEEREFDDALFRDRLGLVASHDGRENSLTIHRDVDVLAARLAPGATVSHPLRPGRGLWLQLAEGTATVDGETIAAGDGVAVAHADGLTVTATEQSEFVLFDMAM